MSAVTSGAGRRETEARAGETQAPAQRGAIFAAVGGLLFGVLIIIGHDVIGAAAGESPAIGASAEEATEHARESDVARFYAGGFIGSVLAGLALLAFVSYVTALIRRWDDGWLPGAAFAAGAVAVTLQLLTMVIVMAAVRWADELDAAVVAMVIVELSQVWALSFVVLAVFIAIASLAAIGGGIMARWIGWFGLVLAPLVVVAEYVHFTSESEVGIAFVPIALSWIVWLPAASISLVLRARAAGVGQHRVEPERDSQPA